MYILITNNSRGILTGFFVLGFSSNVANELQSALLRAGKLQTRVLVHILPLLWTTKYSCTKLKHLNDERPYKGSLKKGKGEEQQQQEGGGGEKNKKEKEEEMRWKD